VARPERKSTQTTKDFSENLSRLVDERKEQGFSQKEIAAGIGIASGTLSDWCSDNKTPTIDAIPKIADYFGVSAAWLIGCSGVRERGTDLQKIHYETGLSSAAITKLMVDKEIGDNNYVQMLNRLIESDCFSDLAKLADVYCRLQADSSLHIDLDHLVPGMEDISIQTAAFIKALLVEYFLRAICEK